VRLLAGLVWDPLQPLCTAEQGNCLQPHSGDTTLHIEWKCTKDL